MVKKLWDWQEFQPLAASYSGKIVRLSGDSLALFLCCEELTEIDRWQSGQSNPSDSEADAIEALTALAFAEIMSSAVIGTIAPYMTATPPIGMLPCDGSSHLRTDYPDLYAALHANFIVDADHFTTPDLRGRVPLGAGTGSGLSTYIVGGNGGQENHALTTAELASHNHTITDPGHTHTLSDPGHSHTVNDPGHGHSTNNPTHTHGITDPGHTHVLTDPGHNHTIPRAAGGVNVFSGSGVNVANNVAGNTGGNTTGITQASATTGVTTNAAAANQTVNNATTGVTTNAANTGASAASHVTNISLAAAGSGNAHENRQPYMALNFGVWAL